MRLTWLLLAAHVPPDGQGGGMVRYVVELARALSALDGVELHVTSARDSVPFWESVVEEPEYVHAMVRSPGPARNWLERKGWGCRAFGGTFDVVQGAKHLLPAAVGGSKVLTVHDFLPLDRPADFGFLKRSFLPDAYLSSIRQADCLLCVSEATRDRLVSYVPQASDRAHVVELAGNALNAEHPDAIPSLEGRPFALVVGDDSARKNVDFVIDLWDQVDRRRPGSVLALVGPSSWKPARRSRPDPPGVVRLGYVSAAQLAWAYTNATTVLCPSRLEGFGLPAREAADLQARLITSEDPALCEVSGPDALHLPAFDGDAWAQAICASFDSPHRPVHAPKPSRTWADVAHQSLEVVSDAIDRTDR